MREEYGRYCLAAEGVAASDVQRLHVAERTDSSSGRLRACIEVSLLHCESTRRDLAVRALVRALKIDPFVGENYHQRPVTCSSAVEGKYAAVEQICNTPQAAEAPAHNCPLRADRTCAAPFDTLNDALDWD